jgi:hypothetical protein
MFYAFDILWDEHANSDDEEEMRGFRNGEDLRYLPLIDRKLRVHAVVPKRGERLLYCDHIEADGEALFRVVCDNDLEGIGGKRKGDLYLLEHAQWLKIRNREYSQWVGREELFERERGTEAGRTHHLNFYEMNSSGWATHILFCEYLKSHNEVAKEYADLKLTLAKNFPTDRASYTNGKEQFVTTVVERAAGEEPVSKSAV